jgi:biotin carboxyl carrier protein
MKLMNEITAECRGVIDQICIEDNAFVDNGTVV